MSEFDREIKQAIMSINSFIDFIDGIQGRDLGGADVLSWKDIESADDMRGFIEAYKAHLENICYE